MAATSSGNGPPPQPPHATKGLPTFHYMDAWQTWVDLGGDVDLEKVLRQLSHSQKYDPLPPNSSIERRFTGIEHSVLWELTDRLYVTDRDARKPIQDADGNFLTDRDRTNPKPAGTTSVRYCRIFLREGLYKDLRGAMQGRHQSKISKMFSFISGGAVQKESVFRFASGMHPMHVKLAPC